VQMKNIYFAPSALLTCCLVSFSTGRQLQPPWYLDAHKEADTGQLCLSNQSTCPQEDGVSLGDIPVYRYDSLANDEIVWETSPEKPITNERITGIITYGIPPKNWHNKLTPVCGKAYLVNPGAKFFAPKCDGNVVVFDFQHLEEFFSQTAQPEPTKKSTGH